MGTHAPATSPARIATIAGLLVGAGGLLVQKLGGMTMPAVPPGMIILIVAAGLLLNPRWRWAGFVAILAGLAELAGFFGSGAAEWLLRPDELGVFAGSWLRVAGVATAVVAGVLAVRAAYGGRSRTAAA